ncbi:tyrosine-type recombinase/integrase [Streptomyces sp. PA03-6a]|nr:tyrosine-type recombinase/integrase [Streptomyces sp. PA03-6a]
MPTATTLTPTDARALLAHTAPSVELHAGVCLMLYAGLRRGELTDLHVRDYTPGAEPTIRIGALRHPRTIRLAPTAAAAVDAYLATQDADPDDYLLPGLTDTKLAVRLRAAANAAGVTARSHDLRTTAVSAVLESGLPMLYLQPYFGLSAALGPNDLDGPPKGYDQAVALALEVAYR